MPDRAWRWTLGLGLPAAVGVPLLPPVGAVLVYDLIAVLSTVAIVVGVRWHRPASWRAWTYLAIGVGSWAVGDAVYTVLGGVTGEPDFPSAADPFYLAGSLATFLAVLAIARRRDDGGGRAAVVDTTIITIAGSVLVWLLVLDPLLSDPSYAPLGRVVAVATPLLDIGLLAAIVLLLLGRGRAGASTSDAFLALGATAMLLSDLAYTYSSVAGTYRVGDAADHGWLLAYVLFAAAALHRSVAHGAPERSPTASLPRLRLVVLGAAAIATPLCFVLVLVAVEELSGRLVRDLVTVAAASASTTSLLLWRTATSSRAMARALHASSAAAARERLIATISTRLARATSDTEVREAVTGLRELFPDRDVSVTLCEHGEAPPPADGVQVRLRDGRDLAAIHLGGVGELSDEVAAAVHTVAREAAMALDRWRLTAELRSSERRFRSLVQHAPDAITVQDADGVITYASPAMGRILGVEPDALIGGRLRDLVHPDDLAAGARYAPEPRDPALPATLERRLRRSDGRYRWVESRLTDRRDDPSVRGIVANHRDVTDRRELEAQLQHQADHDTLTGLPNRRRFRAAIDEALAASRAPVVLYLDLDRFKEVNDRFGHTTGDELLQRAAARIVRCLRPGDVAARLGGDEFAVLLHEADGDHARRVAERLLGALAQPFALEGTGVAVSASIGITTLDEPGLDASTALTRADLAMYEAKRAGRGRALLYEEQHHERALRTLELEAGLRAGVANQQLEVVYQPILDVASGTCTGAEALLRWTHRSYGAVDPEEFIPLAERTGLIVPLGRQVLDEACRQAVAWSRPDRAFAISINVSVHQLAEPGFASDVARTLRDSGHPAHALTLEITESALLDHGDTTIRTLSALRDLGVRLAIDDFGTGYATLRTLEDVPADVLKIDRSFVRNVTGSVEDGAIVRAVLQLARSFELETVAEGVETAEQYLAVRALGCDRAQGYHFAPPLPPAELVPWYRFADEGGPRSSSDALADR
ncbi:EAL domain-containing protein [Nitriliruptoraceae bacterium ZYF776]|nr:EAL domain-containing protein [Profundirhabdus halotolerans]